MSTGSPSMSQEERGDSLEKTKQQIRGLVGEIAQLSKSDLSPEEYYAAFLQRVIQALAAVGGAVWVVGEGGQPQLSYQINISPGLLDSESEDADKHVRPVLDRFKASDERLIGSAITDVNGYLPTHLTERSHKPGPDPVWNDAHCRNKRIFMDETTRNAILSDKPAMLATYRMELGDEYIPVKNVFVPLWIKGRRWGNYELAYRDEAQR